MSSQSLKNVRAILDALAQIPEEPGDLHGTLQHIANSAQKFFEADICTIITLNPITRNFIDPVIVAGEPFTVITYEKPRPRGITHHVLQNNFIMIDDLQANPDYYSLFAQKEEIQAIAASVLNARHRQNKLGVLYLNFRQKKHFSDEQKELFRLFADQASFILQETWLFLHSKKVESIGQEINQDLETVEKLFEKLQRYAVDILDTSYTLLLSIYQRQTNTLDFYLREEGHLVRLDGYPIGNKGRGASYYAIETQSTQTIHHLSEESKNLPFQLLHIQDTGPKESYIFVPLVLRNIALGVLSIQHPEPDAYNQDDLFILQLLANHVSLAIHNIQLYESLTRLSETGQHLTQQLDSEQTLQATVDRIGYDIRANSVILFDYDSTNLLFGHVPHTAGNFLDPDHPSSMHPNRLGNIAKLMLKHEKPLFVQDSADLYKQLGVDADMRQGRFVQKELIQSTAAIRLSVRETVVGVLFINFRQPQLFDRTMQRLIEGLANYAAIAIKNSQRFVTLNQRRQREADILQNIHRDLNSNLDLQSVLETLIVQANELIQANRVAVFLYNKQTETLEIRAAIGDASAINNSLSIPIRESTGITRWVLEHKKPALVQNVHEDPQWRKLYIEITTRTISELDVPLVDESDAVGVLNFESDRESAFSKDDENFLLTLAGQTVLAVKKAQAYEREKRLAEESRALNQISREIISQLSSVYIFDLILEKALTLTNSTLGTFLLYDQETNVLLVTAQRGMTTEKASLRLPLSHGIVGYVATNKQALSVNVTRNPWKDLYVEFVADTVSELAVPMLEDDNVLRGVLNVESPQINHFDDSDLRLLQGLADLAVVALQTTERYNTAKKEAQRFELLYKAGQELSKITSLEQLDQVYEIIVQIAKKQSQGNVVIRGYESNTEELVLIQTSVSVDPLLFPRLKLHEGINGQVAQEKKTMVVKDINKPSPGIAHARLPENSPIRSLLVTPITFDDRYYGNLELNHEEVGYFQEADVNFIIGLAQQMAATLYRLEATQAKQEAEKRATSTEFMGWIGQLIFEVAHRRGNDLGLVKSYVNDIKAELEKQNVSSALINKKLDIITYDTRTVLDMNKEIRAVMGTVGDIINEKPAIIHTQDLLLEARKKAQDILIATCKSSIVINPLEIAEDIATVRVNHKLAAYVLDNLVTNAIEAMSEGGQLTLKAYNFQQQVALEVIDTGTGIPQEKEKQIFDLAYSTKGSTGFGLWSAQRIARYYQGDLRVSHQSGYTVFTLLLPRGVAGVGGHYEA